MNTIIRKGVPYVIAAMLATGGCAGTKTSWQWNTHKDTAAITQSLSAIVSQESLIDIIKNYETAITPIHRPSDMPEKYLIIAENYFAQRTPESRTYHIQNQETNLLLTIYNNENSHTSPIRNNFSFFFLPSY